MFIIEGLLSLGLLFVWLPLVSDHPHQAKWLDPKERAWIEQKLLADRALSIGGEQSSIRGVLKSINLWKLVGIYFFVQVGFYGFALWMPNLIKHLTGSGMTIVGVLTAAPYVLCIIGQYYIAKWCDKTMNRRLYTAIPLLGFAVCLALSLLLKDNVWLAYGMMVICGFFLQAYAGPFWTLPPLLFAPNVSGRRARHDQRPGQHRRLYRSVPRRAVNGDVLANSRNDRTGCRPAYRCWTAFSAYLLLPLVLQVAATHLTPRRRVRHLNRKESPNEPKNVNMLATCGRSSTPCVLE
ncbi:major facilitator superfamily protein [Salmonella enterica subsp. enterica]|uniref:Major facilitator superfamily protein n=1 Tax=Salmonella enterica I TaxID=59201 RepID=A0A3S4HR70_SALET|nr:major facilitator superfamily protein [Salmonella enterica subsp. enterica]